MQLRLLSLLEKVLNEKGNIYKNDDVAFHCPVCNLPTHKKKLIINLNENHKKFGYWRCWNCKDSHGMHGRNLIKLFHKIKASRQQIGELYNILDVNIILKNNVDYVEKIDTLVKPILSLPPEFISITNFQDTNEYKKAVDFLLGRGITRNDIIKYNIGYCETGKYARRIIIPSYNTNGELNYFVARTYDDNIRPKYKNPPIATSDDVIFFDMHINWNMPILLCEGVFDAIAAKRNAIPILGNSIYGALWKKIIFEDVKEIVLALDMDMVKTSLHYIEKFINEGIHVKFIMMGKKDPSELGFSEFIKLYNKSKPLDFGMLVQMKLNI